MRHQPSDVFPRRTWRSGKMLSKEKWIVLGYKLIVVLWKHLAFEAQKLHDINRWRVMADQKWYDKENYLKMEVVISGTVRIVFLPTSLKLAHFAIGSFASIASNGPVPPVDCICPILISKWTATLPEALIQLLRRCHRKLIVIHLKDHKMTVWIHIKISGLRKKHGRLRWPIFRALSIRRHEFRSATFIKIRTC